VWRRGRLVWRGVEDRRNSVRVLDTFLRQCEWPFPWIVWVGWIARAAPAPRFTKQACRRSGRSSEERARALSSCNNPKGPCKRTVRIPGEQANTKPDRSAECRVQTGATVQLERRLQDNARLAPGARGRKLRFTCLGLGEAGWQRQRQRHRLNIRSNLSGQVILLFPFELVATLASRFRLVVASQDSSLNERRRDDRLKPLA
jgi:hypothetical protein